nr:ribonuclease H-like domain-containing protein [Tanacetum cinerariifolium]
MESQSTPVISTVKLPILNPNEFDLWKIRIEQYFLMTDYSLWKMIINGDSPKPSVVIEGSAAPAVVLTVKQKLARRNELKARGTLLMSLPDKHQLKFNSHKDAKTLIEAIDKRIGGNTKTKKVQKTLLKKQFENFIGSSYEDLDQIHDKLQKLVSQLEIHEVSMSQEDVNLNQSTSPQLDNEDLKQIDFDDLEEIDLRWQMAMLTMRARRFLQKTRRNLGDNRVTNMGFDIYQAKDEPANFALMAISSSSSSNNEVQSCSTACAKAFKQLHDQYDSQTVEIPSQSNNKHSLGYLPSVDVSANLSLNCPSDKVQPSGRYNVVPPPITRNFMPPKPDLVFNTAPIAVETAHSAFNVQLSPAKPDESEPNDPQSAPSFVQPSEQVKLFRHSAKPVEAPILAHTPKPTSSKTNGSRKRKNRKTCFVCRGVDHLIKDCTFHVKPKTHPIPRNYVHRGYDKQYASSTKQYPQKHRVPAVVFTKSKPVSVTAARPVSAAVPKIMAAKPRHARSLHIKTNSIIIRHQTPSKFSKTSNSSPKVTTAHAKVVSAAKGKKEKWVWRPKHHILDHDSGASKLQKQLNRKDAPGRSKYDKGVIDSGCSRHMTGNMSYFSDFEERNRGYVAFGGNPKDGKITGKGKIKIDFKLPDESQVLLRVPRENNMYNVNLKDIVPSRDLICLFAKATIDESNLWHRRLGHTPYELLHGRTPSISFMRPFGCLVTILNTLDSLGKFEGKVDEGFLVGYYVNSKAFRVFNSRTRIFQKTLHVNFLENKPNVAGTGPTWLLDIDSLTRTMNYQPVIAGNQTNLSVGFQEEFDAGKTEEEVDQQYMLFSVWSTGLTNPQNKEGYVTFDGKEHDAEKPESTINLSPISSALSGEQNDITKKKDKGKSLVDYFTGNKDFNEDFEDYFKDNSNDVSAAGPIVPAAGRNYSNSTNPISDAVPAAGRNYSNSTNPISAAGPIVPTAGQNYSNSTYPIGAAGPLNTNSSPIHGKSSLQDASQSPDMLESEDSDHENVGAEADFNNLETSITISPIPITRIHNVHPISQIIGNLSSTTQTRSMARINRDQGGIL